MASVIKEYTLKLTTKEAQQNLKQVNDSLNLQDEALIRIQQDLLKYEKQLENTSKKNWRGREKLNEQIARTKKELKEETIGRKKLLNERQKANKQLREAKKDTADFSSAMKILDSATGGAASSMTNLVGGVGKSTKGFGKLKIAMMATGFGLILVAITAVTTALTSNEEGQGKLMKMMNRVKAVITTVTSALTSFGKAALSVGKWLGAKFTGDTEKANEAINEMSENWKKGTDAVKNFGEEAKKNIKLADEMTALQIKNSKVERELLVERAEANAEVAKLREIAADKENVSVEERIRVLKEAAAIEDGIAAKESQLAKDRLAAHHLEMEMGENTKEDLLKEAELIAAVSQIETNRATKKRMLIRTTSAAEREAQSQIDADKKEADDKQKQADADEDTRIKELADLKKNIRDAEANTKDEERKLELIKIKEHYDALILLADENNIVTDELKATRDEVLAEKEAEHAKEDLDKKQEVADKIEKIEKQKRKSAMQTLDTAARLFGEDTKMGKAMLLAKQVMLVKQLIMDAKSQISTGTKVVSEAGMQGTEALVEVGGSVAKGANTAPPPFNIPFILSAVATGVGVMSAVKSAIKATKKAAKGAGGPVPQLTEPSITPAAAPIVPDVTSVGGTGMNQLADAIGSQTQQPMQAYVVSNDITSSQSLERNIIEGASIG